MNKKPTYIPRIVKVSDKHGDELQTRMAPPRLAQELIDDDRVAIRAKTVREDLQSAKRRPWDAPMATRIGSLPDPMAVLSWDARVTNASETAAKWWGKWQFMLALAVWSTACFLLGTLV